jgi:hypothetical protein
LCGYVNKGKKTHRHYVRRIQKAKYINVRYYYVTPTSYLELLATLKRLHGDRTNMVFTQIKRYDNGLDKLKKTEEDVGIMQVKLEQLQPVSKINFLDS